LAADAKAAGLTVVLGAELLRPRVWDALERAAILVLGAVGIFGTARQACVIGARTTGPGDALLGLGARGVQTRQQTLAIDADARVTTLEVKLTTKWGWVGRGFEGIEAKTALGAGRPNRTVVCVLTPTDAA
jgi:hypothetical protein